MSDDIRDDDADSLFGTDHIPTDPIIRRNRQNAQFSTGPKTPEGKAISSENATKHGHRSQKRKAGEMALAAFVYGQWEQELFPVGSIETFALMAAAQHEARRRIIHDAMMAMAKNAEPHHRELRRQPFLDTIEDIKRCIRIWAIVRDDGFEPGEGLQVDFPALLRNLDPKATPRNIGPSGEVHEFVFLHNRAVATPRYRELHRRYATKKRVAESDLDAAEYRRLDERLRKAHERLKEWVVGRIDRLIARLNEAERALAADDALPDRPFAWHAETEEGRKMSRYHAEAESAVRRYMKLFDDHRRRVIRTDLRREQIYNKMGTESMNFGDLQITMPPRYRAMGPRLKLETMLLELKHEMRFYPDRDPNEATYVQEIKEEVGQQEFTNWLEDQLEAEDGRTGGLGGSQGPAEPGPDGDPAD